MKILTINYPKDANDEKKVGFLKSKYDSLCLPKVLKEAEDNLFEAV